MAFVMFWKMLGYQSKKCFADVCLCVASKRRVVPDNVSSSFFWVEWFVCACCRLEFSYVRWI